MAAFQNNKLENSITTDIVHRFAITPYRQTNLSDSVRKNVRKLAEKIKRKNKHLSSTAYFGNAVNPGIGKGKSILISDRSEIRLLQNTRFDPLEYRMAMLASEGDKIILGHKQNTDFELQMKEVLSIEHLKSILIAGVGNSDRPIATRCHEEKSIFKKLLSGVDSRSGVTLVPYISGGSIWQLASKINKAGICPVHVAGPPPKLAACVNDKLKFAEFATMLFGQKALPPQRAAYTPAGLTAHAHQLAQKWEKLVIKVPDSAGSAGNFPVQSDTIKSMGCRDLKDYLVELLSAKVSDSDYPLMVQVWDSDIIASPSAQMWIPLLGDGDPVLEGIYDQVLVGEKGTFVGATLSKLDEKHEELFCDQSMQLACLFQELGYFGRCSFDSVLVRHERQKDELHWIECNGRWGGVSLPMTLVNRLFQKKEKPEFIIVQRSGLEFDGINFDKVLELLKGHLYKPGGSADGIIFTSPGGLEEGNMLQLIALGPSLREAELHLKRVEEILKIRT